MLRGRFPASEFSPACIAVTSQLTMATIELWRRIKDRMLPTPAKFHYLFNLRDLSRVFQGIFNIDVKETLTDSFMLLALWKHECMRVFSDKLVDKKDKAWFAKEKIADWANDERWQDAPRAGAMVALLDRLSPWKPPPAQRLPEVRTLEAARQHVFAHLFKTRRMTTKLWKLLAKKAAAAAKDEAEKHREDIVLALELLWAQLGRIALGRLAGLAAAAEIARVRS
jgi:hypothetical protein